uniref:Cytochrome P450 CYP4C1 n=1 Tax=Diaphorina citri TaxID=121845 RepID=A0A482LME6_DIACI|nr:cytochrome P450 CYP4C1 [Diaphorina citri]
MLEDWFQLFASQKHSLMTDVTHLLYTTTLSILAYYMVVKLKAMFRVYQLASTMNGPKAYPIIGNVLNIYESKSGSAYRSKTSRIIKASESVDDIVRIWIFHKLFLIVKDPLHTQEILRSTAFRKNDYYKTIFGETALGQGILTNVNTEVWKKQRKILTPTFHFKILHSYIQYFYEESQLLCNIIREEAQDGAETKTDMKLKLAGFDMIVRNVLGFQTNAQRNPQHPFVLNIIETMQLTQLRIIQPWLLNKTLFQLFGYHRRQMKAKQELYSFIQNVVAIKRQDHEEKELQKAKGMDENNNKIDTKDDKNKDLKINSENGNEEEFLDIEYKNTKTKSFLELLLEIDHAADDKLTDAEILPELTTLFFAALDTTATANSTILLLLALYPEVLQKVTDEIDSVFGGPDEDDGRPPTPADLHSMNYLECVIKETARPYPPAPIVFRQVDEEVPLVRHVLPAGASIMLTIAGIHRNKNYWVNPIQFIPERFHPDESVSSSHIRQRHPYAFIPFSAGPRNCIGQKYAMLQMKTVISTILRQYHLSPSPRFQTIADIDKRIRMDITLRMEDGAVIFQSRKQ